MMPQPINPQPKGHLAAVLALAVVLLLPGLPAASQTRQQDGPTITPNYKDADLSQIIQAVSEVTGKNFIIDPRVNAKVTMLSATPMSPAAFYEAFLAVLQVYGYVAVPAGKVIKIIPNTDQRQVPANDLPSSVSATSDEIVTQVMSLKNVSAAALVPMLRPLMPQYAQLAPYPSGNMLIISDRASNVHRLMRIIERLDQSGDEPIDVIALHNASAADVVRIITSLNQGAGAEGAGAAVKVVADERTNSILLTGEKSQRLRVKTLIVDMDTPLSSGGDTQVRYLRYADAEKIAEKLKGQASATAKAQGGPPSGPTPTGGGGGSNVDASVTIWADIATNALIITAPPKIMRSLMQVIDKLDIRRAQVQVEALIVEVDVNKSSNLGVQWLLFGQGGGTVPAGVVNLPGAGTSIVDLAAAVLSGGAVGGAGGVTTPITSSTVGTGATVAVGRVVNNGTSFAALVQALRSDGSSNIISTPSLITMNNEEAEVKVTQEIPLITGSYSNTTASVSRNHQPLHDHSTRGSGHDSESHAAHQRRQLGAAQDRAGRFLAGCEADGFGGYFHQQALHQDHGADRGWRHHRARRPDVGHRLAKRGSRSGIGRDSPVRQSVQVAQRLPPEEEPAGVHTAQDIARRRGHREHQRVEIQFHPRPAEILEQRPYIAAARPEAAGRARGAAGVGIAGARAVRREPAGCHPQHAAAGLGAAIHHAADHAAAATDDTARDDTARA